MIKAVTKEEARQALKTIAQYCDDVDCYECEIKDACEKLEIKKYPFFFLAEYVNSVWEIKQDLFKGNEITQEYLWGSRYKGDDVYVDERNKMHEADCYEIIHHEWKIQNRGSIPWRNRKLVMVNQADIYPRPVKKVIPLQDTNPNEFINIATDIDARGFEGDFECKWEMQDADGKNCFPNKMGDFNIRIRVTFNYGGKIDAIVK